MRARRIGRRGQLAEQCYAMLRCSVAIVSLDAGVSG